MSCKEESNLTPFFLAASGERLDGGGHFSARALLHWGRLCFKISVLLRWELVA
jgi:hypothetical protein